MSKTITFEDDEFNEVCELLELITILGSKLWVQGRQPNKEKLSRAFDKLTVQGLEQHLQTIRDK